MEKEIIIDHLNKIVSERINEAQAEIDSINKSKANETKSSAGDKYETGMSMLQMEEQKAAVQLGKAKELRHTLSLINPIEKQDKVQLGSLVRTSNGDYFMSIGLGKLEVNGKELFTVSMASPIGMKIREKKAGDTFEFMGNNIKVIEIH